MVLKAFAMMDKNGSGQITIEDISSVFDVSKHPDFIERRATKEQILGAFLQNFEGMRSNRDGNINLNEFVDYYTDISMLIPADEYFVAMMESTWQCPEDENTQIVKQTVTRLLQEVRGRIFELARRDPKLLKKIFNDFDVS